MRGFFNSEKTGDLAGNKLFFAVMNVTRSFNKMRFRIEISPFLITLLTIAYCIGLHEDKGGEGIIVSQLGEMMGVSRPSMTRTLNGMEDQGLIERRSEKGDRRKVYIIITEKGYQLLKEGQRCIMDRMNELGQRMGEQDTDELTRLLNRFAMVCADFNKEN